MNEQSSLPTATQVESSRLPAWLRKAALAAGIPAFLVVGALVYADVNVTSFNSGDPLSAATMNANFKALQDTVNAQQTTITTLQANITALQTSNTALTSQIAALQIADPECPAGYTRDATAKSIVLCKKGIDEVVKVGSAATAFWADRYEASVWDDAKATSPAQPYGSAGVDDYPSSTFPDTGQWTKPLYAVSKVGVLPSAMLTWFQANAACRASGKRLPTGSEWLLAAKGTGAANDAQKCNVNTSMPRNTGSNCTSDWGAEDMIGNLWEWTDEWYSSVGDATTSQTGWPAAGTAGISGSYGGARVWNVTSQPWSTPGTKSAGLPAAARRGGDYEDGPSSITGLFEFDLNYAPSDWHRYGGFRCVLAGR